MNKYLNPSEVLHKMANEKKTAEVIHTGFPALDKDLDGGFYRKELIVIGAFTGVGKSQLAGQLLYEAADQGFDCAYFSLEIGNEMIVSRLVGAISGIRPTRIRFGNLLENEYKKRLEAEAKVESLGELLHFYDNSYQLDEIIDAIKEKKYEYVVVDFIQNVVTKERDEYSRMTAVSIELQRLAKSANCVIVTLSQLSNQIGREGSKSKNIEYKGSGGIAMVADLGFIFEREGDQMPNEDQLLELTLKKNRRGFSGLSYPLLYKSPGGMIVERKL